jgi:microcompartment protein CcmL/EutN
MSGPALSLVLLSEIPAGLKVLDALSKEAEVTILRTGTIQNGRYLVLFGGDVGSVERSHARALSVAAGHVLDDILLPNAEERIAPAILGGDRRWPAPGDTLGMLQAPTPPVLLRAVDAALKGAEVELVELRVGDGLGGQAIASLWGETHDVVVALAIAEEAFARGNASGASTAMIARADPNVIAALGGGSRFYREWRG